jgi:hypothetical protein
MKEVPAKKTHRFTRTTPLTLPTSQEPLRQGLDSKDFQTACFQLSTLF